MLIAYKLWNVKAFVILRLQKLKTRTYKMEDLRITKTERDQKHLASNLNSAPKLAISSKNFSSTCNNSFCCLVISAVLFLIFLEYFFFELYFFELHVTESFFKNTPVRNTDAFISIKPVLRVSTSLSPPITVRVLIDLILCVRLKVKP